MIFLSACAPSVGAVQVTITQTQTPAPAPTPTRTIRPTEDAPGSDCFRWNEVNKNMEEKEICVYGDFLFSISAADGNGDIGWWLIRFDENASTFYIMQDTLPPLKIQSGDCILVSGKLQFDDNRTPFIENGEITKC
jgi:hypothetical protein